MKKRADGRYVKKVKLQDGTYKYFYSVASTLAKAEKDIQKQLLEFTQKEKKGKLFSEVSDEWEEEHYKNVEYATICRYTTYVNTLNGYFQGRYIKELTAMDIEYIMNDMARKNYSTKTIRDQLSVTKMIFHFAMIKQYIDNDVSFYIQAQKGKPSKQREPLTDTEIKIVNKSINCTFGLLAYFLLYTGLRKGELLALQWKDIDFANKLIHVYKSIYYESNKPCVKLPKTKAGVRDVILLDCLADKLKKKSDSDYVFEHDGGIIDKSYFTRQWKKYQTETGLDITAHQLRHTYATILFEAGIKEKDAQNLMGHSDIKVTQNIYTHIRQKRMNETANILNSFTLSNSCQNSNNH